MGKLAVREENARIRKIFAQNLNRAREHKGIMREQAAAVLDIPVSSYNAYENGRLFPGASRLVELANLYDTSIDALMGYQRFVNFPLLANYRFAQAREVFEQAGVEVECVVEPISGLPTKPITVKSKGKAAVVDGTFCIVEEFTPVTFADASIFLAFAEKLLKAIEQSAAARDIIISALKELKNEQGLRSC